MSVNYEKHIKPYLTTLAIILVVLGIWLRIYNIVKCGFIFYDEGYYLNDDRRQFVEFVRLHHLHGFHEYMQIVYGDLRVALGSGKALWLFLINLRALVHADGDWHFSRVVSTIFGCLTLGIVYL